MLNLEVEHGTSSGPSFQKELRESEDLVGDPSSQNPGECPTEKASPKARAQQ